VSDAPKQLSDKDMHDEYANMLRSRSQATIKSTKTSSVPLSCSLTLLARWQALLAKVTADAGIPFPTSNSVNSLVPEFDVLHTISSFRAPITPSIWKKMFQGKMQDISLVDALKEAYTNHKMPWDSIEEKGFLLNDSTIAYYQPTNAKLSFAKPKSKPEQQPQQQPQPQQQQQQKVSSKPSKPPLNKKTRIVQPFNTSDEVFKEKVLHVKSIGELKDLIAGGEHVGKCVQLDVSAALADSLDKKAAISKGVWNGTEGFGIFLPFFPFSFSTFLTFVFSGRSVRPSRSA